LKTLFTIIIVCGSLFTKAQENRSRFRPVFTAQGAGSIGLFSAGIGLSGPGNKLEGHLLYGFVPGLSSGWLNITTLKFLYNPWKIDLGNRAGFYPLQVSAFLSMHSGENLGLFWDKKYPKGYYWWARNLRQHLGFSSAFAIDYAKGKIDRTLIYLETNTNDLYLYSYFPNMRTIKLWDIFFFGAGLKFYLR
jgi:hypothetical protein